jgi:hypothetical protein
VYCTFLMFESTRAMLLFESPPEEFGVVYEISGCIGEFLSSLP